MQRLLGMLVVAGLMTTPAMVRADIVEDIFRGNYNQTEFQGHSLDITRLMDLSDGSERAEFKLEGTSLVLHTYVIRRYDGALRGLARRQEEVGGDTSEMNYALDASGKIIEVTTRKFIPRKLAITEKRDRCRMDATEPCYRFENLAMRTATRLERDNQGVLRGGTFITEWLPQDMPPIIREQRIRFEYAETTTRMILEESEKPWSFLAAGYVFEEHNGKRTLRVCLSFEGEHCKTTSW